MLWCGELGGAVMYAFKTALMVASVVQLVVVVLLLAEAGITVAAVDGDLVVDHVGGA